MEKRKLLFLCVITMTSSQGRADFVVPVKWWGSLEYGYNYSDYGQDQNSKSNMVSARIGNKSYIWYPWFMTMDLGLTFSETKSSGNSYTNDNNIVTGNAQLSILPQSRFPLSIHYERSDSKIDSSLFTAEDYLDYGTTSFTRERLHITQRLLGNNYKLSAYHTQQTISDTEGTQEENYTNGVEYTLRGKSQTLIFTGLDSKAEGSDGESTKNTLLSAQHTLTTKDGLNNHFLASQTETKQSFSDTVTNDYYLTRIRQASNDALWRSKNNKLSMNIGLRAYETDTGSLTQTTRTEGTSVSAGAGYRLTPNILFSGSASYTVTQVDSEDTIHRAANANASYNSNPKELGTFQYQYFFTGNARHVDNDGETEQTIDIGGGHSLTRSITLSQFTSFRAIGSQNLSLRRTVSDNDVPNDKLASHSLSLNWIKSATGVNSYLQLSASDNRSLESDANSQIMIAQASRRQTLSRRASLGGNATYNWSSRKIQEQDTRYKTESLHALMDYEYSRPFQLQNIRFRSSLKHTITKSSVAQDQRKTLFENRFTHHIGKLDTTLSLTYTEQDTVSSYLFWLKVKRTF